MRYLTGTFWRNGSARKAGARQGAELTGAVRALDTRADGTQGHLADIAALQAHPTRLFKIVGVPLLEGSCEP
jgi:hypothetical protein